MLVLKINTESSVNYSNLRFCEKSIETCYFEWSWEVLKVAALNSIRRSARLVQTSPRQTYQFPSLNGAAHLRLRVCTRKYEGKKGEVKNGETRPEQTKEK